MNEDEVYKQAKKNVDEKVDFLQHLVIYVLINIMLIVINLLTSPGYLWFIWVAFFWGIGLVVQGVSVFAFGGIFQDMKTSMMEKELERLKRSK